MKQLTNFVTEADRKSIYKTLALADNKLRQGGIFVLYVIQIMMELYFYNTSLNNFCFV